MSAPTKQEIHDAELRVAASREMARAEVVNLRATVEDMRTTAHLKVENMRAKMAQSSTLAWAVGFGFVLGKALFGRRRTAKPPRPARKPGQFVGGLVASFAAIVSRYAWRFLSGSMLRMWSAAEAAPAAAPPPAPEPARSTVTTVSAPYTSPRGAGDTVH